MKIRAAILSLWGILLINSVFGQAEWLKTSVFKSPERKHQVWVYWGYNRAQYTTSDIEFKGSGYDFKLFDVQATDRQSPFDANVYLKPSNLTIPQYNFRLGFFINERLSVSIGHDHMKYVTVQDQITTISGTIDSSISPMYAGNYFNQSIQYKSDFIRFEHTDGLNYISIEADYYGHLWKSENKKQVLDFYVGYGAGILFPRSEVDLFNIEGANVFHVAGWGTAFQTGIRFHFIPNVFLNLSVKGGFIQMNDVITLGHDDKARHKFFFLQEMATLGFSVNALNKKWMKNNEKTVN